MTEPFDAEKFVCDFFTVDKLRADCLLDQKYIIHIAHAAYERGRNDGLKEVCEKLEELAQKYNETAVYLTGSTWSDCLDCAKEIRALKREAEDE